MILGLLGALHFQWKSPYFIVNSDGAIDAVLLHFYLTLIFLSLFTWGYKHMLGMHVEVRGQLVVTGSLFLPYGFPRFALGCQAWRPASLTKPS